MTTAHRPTAIDKIWDALTERPGSTTRLLATSSFVGESTAGKALVKLEREGRAMRRPTKPAETWYPCAAETATPPQANPPDAPQPAAVGTTAGRRRTQRADRLGRGELRSMVENWLDEHPDQTTTPTQLGKVLGRSPGAILNALERLIEHDAAVLIRERPRTYQAASE